LKLTNETKKYTPTVGKILDAFDAAPQAVRDDTLMLFLSDHGYHLGDHNLWTKHTNYEQGLLFFFPLFKKCCSFSDEYML